MRKYISIFFFVFLGFSQLLVAQTPQVPSVMYFADIKLNINESARKEIQTHVDALYRSEKYFDIKLERVDFYFPTIEKIFKEENLPDDFKYLVIQESALISDAVSSSNAVGFWQFKKASGEEVGLRVDGAVDERLNIVSSSRGAARYLKRNNNYYGNWLYALLSYNMGAGGAQKVVDDKYFGAKKMPIDKRTHWYIIKFLAHKVAFESAIGRNTTPALSLVEYKSGANMSLREIASETNVDFQLLEEYNKWLKRGSVPDDKQYSVIIPATYSEASGLVALNNDRDEEFVVPANKTPNTNPTFDNRFSKGSDKYPIIEGDAPASNENAVLVTVNGKPGIIAGYNDNLLKLAEIGDISISRFLKFNDLESDDQTIAGQVYYLKAKRGSAPEHYHIVKETENMWSISQKYGIKLNKLRRKNRMEKDEQPKPGRVLWMRFVRPKDEPVEYKDVPVSTDISAENDAPRPVKKQIEKNLPSNRRVENRISEIDTVNNDDYTEQEITEDIEENLIEDDPEQELAEISSEDQYIADDKFEEEVGIEENKESSFSADQEDITFVESEAQASTLGNVNEKVHRVKSGETLYSIARNYNIQLGEILQWNDISLKDGIKVDQLLKVAPPEEVEEAEKIVPEKSNEEFVIHEVAGGETMYKIARDHNVTIKDVMQWNNKSDFKVSIGEKLKIKKVN